MRRLTVCGLALAAALSFAACGGGGDSVSERTPTVDEIRELTGLSVPMETPEAAQARHLDIFPRADSLILSTMHGETGSAEIPTFRLLTQCSGAQCTLTDPLSGAVDTIELVNTPLRHGAATAIGSKHGITLVSRVLGAYGSGPCQSRRLDGAQHVCDPEREPDRRGGHGRRPVRDRRGRSRWVPSGTHSRGPRPGLGLMVGTPVTGDARGERLVGDAVLTYQFPTQGSGHTLDAAFAGIRNIDRGTAHTRGDGDLSRDRRGRPGRDLRERHRRASAYRAASSVPATPRRRASSSSPTSSVPSARGGSRRRGAGIAGPRGLARIGFARMQGSRIAAPPRRAPHSSGAAELTARFRLLTGQQRESARWRTIGWRDDKLSTTDVPVARRIKETNHG